MVSGFSDCVYSVARVHSLVYHAINGPTLPRGELQAAIVTAAPLWPGAFFFPVAQDCCVTACSGEFPPP